MHRYLDDRVRADLAHKLVILTGPRQVGKTTLARQVMQGVQPASYLNWDVPADRAVLQRQSWPGSSRLLVMDEIHKMPHWKAWLKGVVDGRPDGQALLVTGSARMETFRQSGESLAGRYFAYRLHPISVREWCEQQGGTPEGALQRLMERGGFPEPCLAATAEHADRWRAQYLTDLVREDVLEFSRIQEIKALRLFVEMLRERVGSPLSLASIARDLAVAPNTLKRYLDILQALFIVFTVQPWHRNVARAVLQAPKVYFYDTALVQGDEGLRFENAVAAMLLKHVQFLADAQGQDVGLHYVRTKDSSELDFVLSAQGQLTHLLECKLSDDKPHRALQRFAAEWPAAQAIQLVRNLRQEQDVPAPQPATTGQATAKATSSAERAPIQLRRAADWLRHQLAA
jgi:predicted AAA+ superfamily ATPase